MSGIGSAATTAFLVAAAVAAGAALGGRGPRAAHARSRGTLGVVWAPALVAGVALRLVVELFTVPGGVVLLLASYALLLAACVKNLAWTGTPLVLLGLGLMVLPAVLDGGTPVSRQALAQMGHPSPPAALPGERHLEVERDQLRVLGDILPLPVGGRPTSFGELILLVGLADVAFNVSSRRSRRRRPAFAESVGDSLAGLVVDTDPLEDEPTVVVLGPPGQPWRRVRAGARAESGAPSDAGAPDARDTPEVAAVGRGGRPARAPGSVRQSSRRGPRLFDVEADDRVVDEHDWAGDTRRDTSRDDLLDDDLLDDDLRSEDLSHR